MREIIFWLLVCLSLSTEGYHLHKKHYHRHHIHKTLKDVKASKKQYLPYGYTRYYPRPAQVPRPYAPATTANYQQAPQYQGHSTVRSCCQTPTGYGMQPHYPSPYASPYPANFPSSYPSSFPVAAPAPYPYPPPIYYGPYPAQSTPNCCQTSNPPSCCINLKPGDSKQLALDAGGQKYILSINLDAERKDSPQIHKDSSPQTKPTTPASSAKPTTPIPSAQPTTPTPTQSGTPSTGLPINSKDTSSATTTSVPTSITTQSSTEVSPTPTSIPTEAKISSDSFPNQQEQNKQKQEQNEQPQELNNKEQEQNEQKQEQNEQKQEQNEQKQEQNEQKQEQNENKDGNDDSFNKQLEQLSKEIDRIDVDHALKQSSGLTTKQGKNEDSSLAIIVGEPLMEPNPDQDKPVKPVQQVKPLKYNRSSHGLHPQQDHNTIHPNALPKKHNIENDGCVGGMNGMSQCIPQQQMAAMPSCPQQCPQQTVACQAVAGPSCPQKQDQAMGGIPSPCEQESTMECITESTCSQIPCPTNGINPCGQEAINSGACLVIQGITCCPVNETALPTVSPGQGAGNGKSVQGQGNKGTNGVGGMGGQVGGGMPGEGAPVNIGVGGAGVSKPGGGAGVGMGGEGPPPGPGAAAPPGSCEQQSLNQHNLRRRQHGVPPLRLNADMNRSAQQYAKKLAATQTGNLQHSSRAERPGQGENLAMTCQRGGNDCKKVTDNWYNEINKYNFNAPGFSMGTGHFTQVVWKNSKELGIGMASYSDPRYGTCYMIVARYKPPGNVQGQFPENVPRKTAG